MSDTTKMQCVLCARHSNRHDYQQCLDCGLTLCAECNTAATTLSRSDATSDSPSDVRCDKCAQQHQNQKLVAEYSKHTIVPCNQCVPQGSYAIIAEYPEQYRQHHSQQVSANNIRVYSVGSLYECSDCHSPICDIPECSDKCMFVRCGSGTGDLLHGTLNADYHYVPCNLKLCRGNDVYTRLVYLCPQCQPKHDVRLRAQHTTICAGYAFCTVCNCNSCGVNYFGQCRKCNKPSCLAKHFDATAQLCVSCAAACDGCQKKFDRTLSWGCQWCKSAYQKCSYCPECEPTAHLQVYCFNPACDKNPCKKYASSDAITNVLCRQCQFRFLPQLFDFAQHGYVVACHHELDAAIPVRSLQSLVMEYANVFHPQQTDFHEFQRALLVPNPNKNTNNNQNQNMPSNVDSSSTSVLGSLDQNDVITSTTSEQVPPTKRQRTTFFGWERNGL